MYMVYSRHMEQSQSNTPHHNRQQRMRSFLSGLPFRRPTENALAPSSTDDASFKFALEDTYESCYRDFSSFLVEKGWKRIPVRKKSKLEKRLPVRKEDTPLLCFLLNEKDVDFQGLAPQQICNHFEGMARTLTTKSGFCDLLREMDWMDVDSSKISPRCYNLGDPVQREEFVDDFRLTAACNILKTYLWADLQAEASSSSSRNMNGCLSMCKTVLSSCISACVRYLRIKETGEWPGVDKVLKVVDGDNIFALSEPEWTACVEASYKLSELHPLSDFSVHLLFSRESEILSFRVSEPASSYARRVKIWLILKALQLKRTQFNIDGLKNIWIIKAPEACKGVGIKLLYRLNDILDCEKGMGGRTAQKYVETPLLSPMLQQDGDPSTGLHVKFDLRVWVVVTSVYPLKSMIYSRVYGRTCCTPYSDEVRTLGDSSIHLTNYSIQRNFAQNDPQSANSAAEGDVVIGSGLNAIKTLRNNSSPANTKTVMTKADLLLNHDDVVNTVTAASSSSACTWDSFVWPAIKEKIIQTLQAACCSGDITQRERSFEFLGFDVMLDSNLNPWILEVNMSPALAHREAKQNSVIAQMAARMLETVIFPLTGLPSVDTMEPQRVFSGAVGDSPPKVFSTREGVDGNFGEWEVLNVLDPTCTVPEKYDPCDAKSLESRRPQSAGRIRPNKKNAKIADWEDINTYSPAAPTTIAPLEVCAKAISVKSILVIDRAAEVFAKMQLIQFWFRRFLNRTRLYHSKRHKAMLEIGRVVRGFLGKCRLWHLRRQRASLIVQCRYRQHSAYLALISRRKTRFATRIQCLVRMYISKKRKHEILLNHCARNIQRFVRLKIDIWKRKASFKIVRKARMWVARRWRHAQVVRSVVSLYYRRRKRSAKIIQSNVRRYLVRRHLEFISRHLKLRSIALEAAKVVDDREKKRLNKIAELERLQEIENKLTSDEVQKVLDYMIVRISRRIEREEKLKACFLFEFVDKYDSKPLESQTHATEREKSSTSSSLNNSVKAASVIEVNDENSEAYIPIQFILRPNFDKKEQVAKDKLRAVPRKCLSEEYAAKIKIKAPEYVEICHSVATKSSNRTNRVRDGVSATISKDNNTPKIDHRRPSSAIKKLDSALPLPAPVLLSRPKSATTSRSKVGRPFKEDFSLQRTKYFNCLDADYLEALASLTKDIDLSMKVDQHADDNLTLPTTEEDSISCITDDFYSGSDNRQDGQNKSKGKSERVSRNQYSTANMHRRRQEHSRETSTQIVRERQKKHGLHRNNRNVTDAIDLTNFVAPSFDFL